MRFTMKTPEVTDLQDQFYCRSRRKHALLETCLDGYVDANAFGKKASACFRCPIGMVNRRQYAGTGGVDEVCAT